MPAIAINRVKKRGNFLRIGKCRHMFFYGLRKRTLEIRGRIAFCSSRCYGISENLTGNSSDPVCRLKSATAFHAPKDGKQLGCPDIGYGPLSYPREKVPL